MALWAAAGGLGKAQTERMARRPFAPPAPLHTRVSCLAALLRPPAVAAACPAAARRLAAAALAELSKGALAPQHAAARPAGHARLCRAWRRRAACHLLPRLSLDLHSRLLLMHLRGTLRCQHLLQAGNLLPDHRRHCRRLACGARASRLCCRSSRACSAVGGARRRRWLPLLLPLDRRAAGMRHVLWQRAACCLFSRLVLDCHPLWLPPGASLRLRLPGLVGGAAGGGGASWRLVCLHCFNQLLYQALHCKGGKSGMS